MLLLCGNLNENNLYTESFCKGFQTNKQKKVSDLEIPQVRYGKNKR